MKNFVLLMKIGSMIAAISMVAWLWSGIDSGLAFAMTPVSLLGQKPELDI